MSAHPPVYPPSGPQPGLHPISPRRPPARSLRWLLLVAVVAPSVLSVLLTPVKVSPDKLLTDLRSGDVQKVSRNCGESGDGDLHVSVETTADLSHSLCWTDGILLYRTSIRALRADLDAEPGSTPVDVVGTVRTTASAAGQPEPSLVVEWVPWWSTLLAVLALMYLVGMLAMVVLLVTGPQPRFMTKWAVFWTLGMPLNAGLLWWLFHEAPWSPRARAMPEPADYAVRVRFDGRKRRSGGEMFLWLLLTGVIWGGLAVSLEHAAGAVLEPQGLVSGSFSSGR